MEMVKRIMAAMMAALTLITLTPCWKRVLPRSWDVALFNQNLKLWNSQSKIGMKMKVKMIMKAALTSTILMPCWKRELPKSLSVELCKQNPRLWRHQRKISMQMMNRLILTSLSKNAKCRWPCAAMTRVTSYRSRECQVPKMSQTKIMEISP